MGVGGQRQTPVALPLGKRQGTHFAVGWVGPKTCLNGCRNLDPPGFDPHIIKPGASLYRVRFCAHVILECDNRLQGPLHKHKVLNDVYILVYGSLLWYSQLDYRSLVS